MTNTNTYLNLAKKAKRDEFYTRYQTIADELPFIIAILLSLW